LEVRRNQRAGKGFRLFRRWLENKQGGEKPSSTEGLRGPRVGRYSGGWAALRKRLQAEPGLRVIDIGYTSPSNINYLTSLGHSVYMADLVHDACTGNWTQGTDEDGNPIWDAKGFLDATLKFAEKKFDIVLLWTTLDYLPEGLVAPVVGHLYEAMNPGGSVLALFHTRMHGEDSVLCRFHLTPTDEVEIQLMEEFPIQRAFTNRSIERLFTGWGGLRQFLARDAVSEVIIVR
jgi:hypothetical protein